MNWENIVMIVVLMGLMVMFAVSAVRDRRELAEERSLRTSVEKELAKAVGELIRATNAAGHLEQAIATLEEGFEKERRNTTPLPNYVPVTDIHTHRTPCAVCSGWGYLLFASVDGPDEAHDKEPCEACDGQGSR